MSTTPPTTCPVHHQTWQTRAACEWPAATISGDGQWASVRHSRAGVSVWLHSTRAEAQADAIAIDGRVVDLAWPHRKRGRS